MNEIFGATAGTGTFLTAVLVPFVSGVLIPLMGLRLGPRDPAAIRSMSRHSRLHDSLPDAAREPIRKLIEFEAAKYARATMRKGKRTFQWSNFAAVVVIVFLLGVVESLLIAVALEWWPAYLIAGVIGGFGGALVGYGLQRIFKYEDGDPLAPTASEEGRPAEELSQIR